MTPHTALLSGPTTAAIVSGRSFAPVLIQVPTLVARRRSGPRPPIRRGRRRLRREIRVAASALIFALPISYGLLSFPRFGLGPDPAADKAAIAPTSVPAPVEEGPRVWLSLSVEPSAAARRVEGAPLAVPAGYVVPDDRAEEAFDAGR